MTSQEVATRHEFHSPNAASHALSLASTLQGLESALQAVKSANFDQLTQAIDALANSLAVWQDFDRQSLLKTVMGSTADKRALQAQLDRMLALSLEALYTLDELQQIKQQRLAVLLPQDQVAYSAQGRLSTRSRT